MSFLRGMEDPAGDNSGMTPAQRELRKSQRRNVIGTGTLACPHCDAPVALPGRPVSPADPLACPYCGHAAPARDFLSMKQPARPNRVVITVSLRR